MSIFNLASGAGAAATGISPIGIGLGAISLGRSLFGGRKHYNYKPGKFSFNPGEYNPQYALRRTQALRSIQEDHSDTMNELGRSGLLGSSAAFGVLDRQSKRGSGLLDDIYNDSLDKMYNHQLDAFNRVEDFNQRRALMSDQGDQQDDLQGLQDLGGIGEYLGGEIDPELKRRLLALGG